MRTRNLVLHVLNVVLPAAAFVAIDHPLVVASGALLLFFAVFALFHDVLHGALGLGRRASALLLLVTGAFIGVSGPAARRMHLVHHARPFTDDDLEGAGARAGLLRALLGGPAMFVRMPRLALARVGPRARRAQLSGWLGVALVQLALVLAGGRWHLLAGATLALQATIPAWGSWAPHRGPAWLRRLGGVVDRLGWSLPIGLAHHELHHERPAIATFDLPAAAREAAPAPAPALPPGAPA